METITIQVGSIQKARILLDLLRSVDFIENIQSKSSDVATTIDSEQSEDFFALAGLWAGRDIDQTSLRKLAWPNRS